MTVIFANSASSSNPILVNIQTYTYVYQNWSESVKHLPKAPYTDLT